MDKFFIVEVNTENQLIVRGQLMLDLDDLSCIVGSGRTSDVYAVFNYNIKSSFIATQNTDSVVISYVAKIWRQLPIASVQVDKLRYMARNKLTYKSSHDIIWPEYLLVATPSSNTQIDTDGSSIDTVQSGSILDEATVVGYLMPRVLGAWPLYKLIDPAERAQLPLSFKDSRFLYHVAINLARAFYSIHKQHHIMGDTNPTNILVTSDGEVVLIDCDSFQIQRNSTEFYAADKHSSSSGALLEVNKANDLINMAILIFQLLMQGAHPFAGRNNGSIVISTSLRAQRIFSFMHPTYVPIEDAPSINCLPESVQQLFLSAFTNQPHNPPSTVDWVKTLKPISTKFVQCSTDPHHYHVEGLPCTECAWQKGRSVTNSD